MSNHSTRSEAPVLRAPPAGSTGAGGLPSWALPAAVVLTAGDAASSLIDPALPLLAAGAVVGTVAAGVAGNSLLLPRLRQLPARSLEVQATRQKLLAQVGGWRGRVLMGTVKVPCWAGLALHPRSCSSRPCSPPTDPPTPTLSCPTSPPTHRRSTRSWRPASTSWWTAAWPTC